MSDGGGRIRIATHMQVAWMDAPPVPGVCPNCGIAAGHRPLLEIDYHPPGAAHRFILLICPHCSVRFTDNPEMMDYGTTELIEIGWHVYQIQIGAGVWPITAPLTRITKPAGARLLEIGGAYGFGLDFGVRGCGWEGVGYDPSPLAEFGARELGLTIRQDYFEEKDLALGAFDIAMATEVIEHLPHPAEFLALMRRALAGDGILVLTTPDAEWITPELDAARLLPLLSPGAHVVLQTAKSLRLALAAAGFANVVVRRESMSLIAYASAMPFELSESEAAGRATFRRYLVERSQTCAPTSDLRLGFAGRGLFEAANDGDDAAAEQAWQDFAAATRARFGFDPGGFDPGGFDPGGFDPGGFDPGHMSGLPAGVQTASLAELGRLMPLGLGMSLFGRTMQRLGRNERRPDLLPMFRLAAAACLALQAALARRSLVDGLTASILAVIEKEVAICLADAGEPAAVAAVLAQVNAGPAQQWLGWRGLIGLMNAGAYQAAASLQAVLGLQWPGHGEPETSLASLTPAMRADALAALFMLDLRMAAPAGLLTERLGQLRLRLDDEDRHRDLMFATFVTLVNRGDGDAALALSQEVASALARLRAPYEAGARDALFAYGILGLRERDALQRGVMMLARLRDDLLKDLQPGAVAGDLFWSALRAETLGLLQQDRRDEARALTETFVPLYAGAPDDLLALLPAEQAPA